MNSNPATLKPLAPSDLAVLGAVAHGTRGSAISPASPDPMVWLAMAAYHLACPLNEDSDENTMAALRILRDARARLAR